MRAKTASLPRTYAALPFAATPIALIVLGVAMVWLYYWGRALHRFIQWIAAYTGLFIGQRALYVMACYAVMRATPYDFSSAVNWLPPGLAVILALAFREPPIAPAPYL